MNYLIVHVFTTEKVMWVMNNGGIILFISQVLVVLSLTLLEWKLQGLMEELQWVL